MKIEDSSDTETGDFKKAKKARSTNATAGFRAAKTVKDPNNHKARAGGIPPGRSDPESGYETEEKGI